MDELKLSTANPGHPYAEEITDKERIKKKRGCGCFLMGCFALVLLMSLPPIGFMIYLGTLSDADYGAFAVRIFKNPDVAIAVKEGIRDNNDLSPEEKSAITAAYDALLNKYDALPADKKDAVHRNIVAVVKKAIADPDGFAQEPPQELSDLLNTLGIGAPVRLPQPATGATSLPTTPPNPPAVPVAPAEPQKPQDPYSFDLPTTPDPQAKDDVESSQYDF